MAEYGGMFFSRGHPAQPGARDRRYGNAVAPGADPEVFAWIDGDRRDEGLDAIERIQGKLRVLAV